MILDTERHLWQAEGVWFIFPAESCWSIDSRDCSSAMINALQTEASGRLNVQTLPAQNEGERRLIYTVKLLGGVDGTGGSSQRRTSFILVSPIWNKHNDFTWNMVHKKLDF